MAMNRPFWMNTKKILHRFNFLNRHAPEAVDGPSKEDKNYFTEMCSGSEAGSCLMLIDL